MSRPLVGLVDYGFSANLLSVRAAFERAGARVSIVSTPEALAPIDMLCLPGVGSFPDAMASLTKREMVEPIRARARKIPTLGICLGAQLLTTVSFEFTETAGLDLIPGEVRQLPVKKPLPHLGWNAVSQVRQSTLFDGIPDATPFYFMHSYEAVNFTDGIGLSSYGDHTFLSAFLRENICGTQFHPEKSRDQGITLLTNFLRGQ